MPPLTPDNTSKDTETSVRYAGFGVRAIAAMVDTLVFIPAILISFQNQLTWKSLPMELCLIAILMLYKPFMEWKYQSTIGKMALKIKVTDEVGGPLIPLQSFIRSSLFMASSVISSLSTIEIFNNPDFQDVRSFETLMKFQEHIAYESATQSISFVLMAAVMMVVFDRQHQGIHDKMARTFCVYQ